MDSTLIDVRPLSPKDATMALFSITDEGTRTRPRAPEIVNKDIIVVAITVYHNSVTPGFKLFTTILALQQHLVTRWYVVLVT